MAGQSVLTVGVGEEFATINAAILAADAMGGNADIKVDAGTYTNDGGYLSDGIDNVTIEGVGGTVFIVDPTYNAGGKAAIVTGGQNIVLENLDISGVTVPDRNGAGVRYDQGTLTLDNVTLHGNQNGILGAIDPNGSITIENSDIYDNGTSAGNTHNIYIGNIATFTLTNSDIHDANVGHEIKSRAENNIITNNVIADNLGTSSYSIDLPNGGNATITGNTIEQGPNNQNHIINSYGEEGATNTGNSVTFADNIILNDDPHGAGPLWVNDGGTITGGGNSVYNLSLSNLGTGVNPSGYSELSSEPAIQPASSVATIVADLVTGDAYRFFVTANGTQFLSINPNEIATVLATRPDMTFEGSAFATVTSSSDTGSIPVFRFFDAQSGTHFYTASQTEEASLIKSRPDLVYEGSSFKVDPTAQPGDVPVYRFFDSSDGSHFYTSSSAEESNIQATRPDMISEGVAFYVPAS